MFWKRQAKPKDSTDYFSLIMDMGKLIFEQPEISEESLNAELSNLGYSDKSIRRTFIFASISFGNDVLRRMGVCFPEDTYHFLLNGGNKTVERSLESEPSFVAAEQLKTGFQQAFGVSTFLRLANTSASLSAVNKALSEGYNLDDFRGAIMSPPVVWGID